MTKRSPVFKNSVKPLNINRLDGRMVRLINTSSRNEILFVGDISAKLEYWFGLMRALSDFGSVTSPDLPGIGGMTSFYKIGRKPTIDNFADYLASFIKLRYKKRRIIIVGVGFGFVVINRMLANYPDIAKKVNLVVSLGGYTDNSDFSSKWGTFMTFKFVGKLYSNFFTSPILRALVYNKGFLKMHYFHRLRSTKAVAAKVLLKNEVERWQSGDLRTFGAIMSQLTSFSNCNKPIDVRAYHLFLNDRSIVRNRVEQHLRVVFDQIIIARTSKRNTYVLKQDKRAAAYFLPTDLKQLLNSF